jgi:HEAT repeat protein
MSGIEKSDLVAEFTCGSDQRAELAALQLSAAGSQGLEILAELLEDQNPEVRWWATRSLADIHNTVAVPLLLNTINDTDSGVQQCAALALRGQPDAQSIPQLVSLLGAEDRLLSRLAGDALIAIGEEAVPALIEVMDSGPQPAQLEAVRALASIGDTRAIPALIKVLDQDSAVMQHWAEQGLEKMGVGTVFFEP